MATAERLSISVDREIAEGIRALVEQGVFPSVSSAFGTAGGVLLALEAERAAWWEETVRRCDEAERHPERLIKADDFFKELRTDIKKQKQPDSE